MSPIVTHLQKSNAYYPRLPTDLYEMTRDYPNQSATVYPLLTRLSDAAWEQLRSTHFCLHKETPFHTETSIERHGIVISQLAKCLVDTNSLSIIEQDTSLSVAAGEITRFVIRELQQQNRPKEALDLANKIQDTKLQHTIRLFYLKSLAEQGDWNTFIDIFHQTSSQETLNQAMNYVMPSKIKDGFSYRILRLLDPLSLERVNSVQMRAKAIAAWACNSGIFDILWVNQVANVFNGSKGIQAQVNQINKHASDLRDRAILGIGLCGVALISLFWWYTQYDPKGRG